MANAHAAPSPTGEQSTFGAGPPTMFMPCAMDQRLERQVTANIECTDAFGRIKFMAADGEQIDTENVDLGKSRRSRSLALDTLPQAALLCFGMESLLDADMVVGSPSNAD